MTPRREDPYAGVNLLHLSPSRDVEWKIEADGRVVLFRERPRVRGPRSLVRWLSFVMTPPRIRLDDVGSFVWCRLDGRTAVGSIAEELRREFGERVEPAEQRLGEMIRLLRRERLLSYPEPEADPPAGA